MSKPLDRLKHHVTGAIERGEKTAIEAVVNSKHTPTPWSVRSCDILGRDGGTITEVPDQYPHVGDLEREANAERIVACVNALEGVANPDAFVDAARMLRLAACEFVESPTYQARANLAETIEVFDRLALAALSKGETK